VSRRLRNWRRGRPDRASRRTKFRLGERAPSVQGPPAWERGGLDTWMDGHLRRDGRRRSSGHRLGTAASGRHLHLRGGTRVRRHGGGAAKSLIRAGPGVAGGSRRERRPRPGLVGVRAAEAHARPTCRSGGRSISRSDATRCARPLQRRHGAPKPVTARPLCAPRRTLTPLTAVGRTVRSIAWGTRVGAAQARRSDVPGALDLRVTPGSSTPARRTHSSAAIKASCQAKSGSFRPCQKAHSSTERSAFQRLSAGR
jgi:hypothetical protein